MSADSEIAAIKARQKPSKSKLSSAAVAADAKAKLRAKSSSRTSATPADLQALDTTPLDPHEAVVYDPSLARSTACIAVEIQRRQHVFSPGASGPLSESQRALYCETTEHRDLSPKLRQRQEAMVQAVETCRPEVKDLPKGERMEPWLGCLSRELRSKKQRL